MSDNLVLEPGEAVASAARTDAPPAILMERVNKWFGALHVLRDRETIGPKAVTGQVRR